MATLTFFNKTSSFKLDGLDTFVQTKNGYARLRTGLQSLP
jgi:hypothetical protein